MVFLTPRQPFLMRRWTQNLALDKILLNLRGFIKDYVYCMVSRDYGSYQSLEAYMVP